MSLNVDDIYWSIYLRVYVYMYILFSRTLKLKAPIALTPIQLFILELLLVSFVTVAVIISHTYSIRNSSHSTYTIHSRRENIS